MKRSASAGRALRLAKAAGWIGIGMGAVHVVVSPLERRDVWSRVLADGVWNTFTLEPTTAGEHERAEVFWTTVGSWGVPTLAFGCYVVWSAHQHHRVPGWLGWLLLGWGAPLVIMLPASPGWAFPLMGGLIVLGDRRDKRAIAEQGPAVSIPAAAGDVRSEDPLNASGDSANERAGRLMGGKA